MNRSRPARITAVAVAAACMASLALTAAPSAGAQAPPTDVQPTTAGVGEEVGVVPGVTYTSKKISGPNKIHVVIVAPGSDATIDVATAVNVLPGYVRTSTIATEHNAIAAVNGDFGLSPGRPGHALAEDANLMQTSPLGADGKNFAIRADETKAHLGSAQIQIQLKRGPGEHFSIERWNDGTAHATEIGAFTNYGGSVANPPNGACSARLLPDGPPDWDINEDVERHYIVGAVACGAQRMPLGDGMVIATPSGGTRADDIKSLIPDDEVTLTWSFGWPGILDAVGGSPTLIEKGNIKVKSCGSYLCQRHPRTAVGIKGNGDIMLFQVDGRSRSSRGMTLVQLARAMKSRGAQWALNLDGGGSSTMWIKGKGVVNNPSDGPERGVTNALLVLPHDDPGDPNGMLSTAPVFEAQESGPTGAIDPRLAAAQDLAMSDPGSTGGLLDAIANGDIAGSPRLPRELQTALDSFRASRR